MEKPSLNFIFINGRGSSGKDTQANFLAAENSNAIRISTGDIVRGAKIPEGEYGEFYEQLKPHFELADKGGLIPDEVIVNIVGKVIEKQIEKGKDTFIFTGFPRTTEQLRAVDDYTRSLKKDCGNVRTDYVCYAVLEEHSRRRAKNRLEKAQNEGTAIRQDDESNIVETRLRTYKALTAPMLHLLAREKRLHVIKSSGIIEDIRKRTVRALELQPPAETQGRNPYEKR